LINLLLFFWESQRLSQDAQKNTKKCYEKFNRKAKETLTFSAKFKTFGSPVEVNEKEEF
jgi:hypothetical protein